MTYLQYCRIETNAGGVACTNREFISACLKYILPQARHHYLYRNDRHKFIRDGLKYLNKSRELYGYYRF